MDENSQSRGVSEEDLARFRSMRSHELSGCLDDCLNRHAVAEVKELVRLGADIHYQDPCFGHSALITAAWTASPELVNYLLSIGADIRLRNKDGLTALEKVKTLPFIVGPHAEVVELLEATEAKLAEPGQAEQGA